MDAPAALAVTARAKINLYLHVLGRRADGYHLLDSLVAFATLGDRMTVRPAPRLALHREGPFAADLPAGEDDLVLRAVRAAARHLGRAPDLSLSLDKRLPVASGIGGGSADAAAALRLAARLWRRDAREFAGIAAALGADVPMCLVGRAAFAGGAGEVLAPAPALPPVHIVLVNPGIPLPTAQVFARHAASGLARHGTAARFAGPVDDVRALARLLAARGNDLEPAAMALVPDIATVLASLSAREGCLLARMSGSGATCFGLFKDAVAAWAAANWIAAAEPRWWVRSSAITKKSAVVRMVNSEK
ncbi:MAG: 4-(cytidine 5'-diphospho)-2-C-methyl-D-erythritol kinase [Alphaproteobacteria bacterium]|nr:4-(cytidine 5'-diphospho)-2-C-methyl-D-erythritol kinase [Alphaproteobacteria bacterium]